VVLACFFGVIDGVVQVALCHVPMMTRFFMVASFVMFRRRPMMMRSLFVVFGSLSVMLGALLRHLETSKKSYKPGVSPTLRRSKHHMMFLPIGVSENGSTFYGSAAVSPRNQDRRSV
jgi:hypothetical protein